jgi:hypothetical protein
MLNKLQQPRVCTDSAIFARLTAYAAANGLSDVIERIRPARDPEPVTEPDLSGLLAIKSELLKKRDDL